METSVKSQDQASIKISEKEFEISGPVDFVKEQIGKLDELVVAFIERIKVKNDLVNNSLLSSKESPALPSHIEIQPKTNDFAEFEEVQKSPFDSYKSILSVINDRVQILVPIPGNSLGNRMINLILVHLWVRLQQKVELVSFAELRSICETHGELDSAHFAEYIKNNKRFFIIEGEGKKLLARLTVPGILETEKLLSSMNLEKK